MIVEAAVTLYPWPGNRVKNTGTQLAFSFLFSPGSPSYGMVSPTFSMCLPISTNLIWNAHHRHAYKFVLMVILNAIKCIRIYLTVCIGMCMPL